MAEGHEEELVDVTYIVTLTATPSQIPSVEGMAYVIYHGTDVPSEDSVFVRSDDPLTR